MHDLKVSGRQAPLTGQTKRNLTSPNSLFWLVLVSAAFLAAELTPALLRMPLGADEITYIARTSVHASGVSLPPVHGQGMGLMAAPVTLLTTSLTAIRMRPSSPYRTSTLASASLASGEAPQQEPAGWQQPVGLL